MADPFGEDLFSVFEENSSTQAQTSTASSVARLSDTTQRDNTTERKTDAERAEDLLRSIVGKRDPDTGDDGDQKSKKVKASAADEISSDIMPRIQVHKVDTVEACLHEVAIPPDAEFVPLKPPSTKAATEFPFILDPFQKEALLCLENYQSVLVSAHTSAGKTVVAMEF